MTRWAAYPSADCSLREGTPLTGNGTDLFLGFGYGAAPGDIVHLVQRFDITTLPTETIITAVVELTITSINVSLAGLSVLVYGLTEGSGAEFEEGQGLNNEANWTNFAEGAAWVPAGGATDGVLGHATLDASTLVVGRNNLDVTDLVVAARAQGYTTLGLLYQLSGDGTGRSVISSTRESASVAVRPLLMVTLEDVSDVQPQRTHPMRFPHNRQLLGG